MNPSPGRSIVVQTYDGQDVPNSIDLDPSPQVVEFTKFSQRRGNLVLAGARLVGPPTGRYNCHGLVFANRRSNIPPADLSRSVSIDELLARDHYQKVAKPQLGDVVIYRTRSGSVEHTGIVSRIETVGDTEKEFVWSKWGALEECEHLALACPYADCDLEYWRLK
jgi:hypothetical protein